MINGMNLSEMQGVKQAYLSHYRKLYDIVHQKQPNFNQLDPSMV